MSHSPAIATGLTVDGADWTRTDLGILARVTDGLFDGLEVRGRDTVVPALVGQIPRLRLGDTRVIKAEGMVMGVGVDEAAQRAALLATRIAIDALMRPDQDPYDLVVTNEDGSTATIEARPLRVEWGSDRLPSFREFTAYWRSVVPDWTFDGGGS